MYMLLNLCAVHSGLAKSLLKVAFFFQERILH